jgi:stage V sporulation protein AB
MKSKKWGEVAMKFLSDLLLILIGLSGGVAVGGGFVAFITVLDIVPRLVQLTRTPRFVLFYEYAIIFGVVFFTWFDFRDGVFFLPRGFGGVIGLFMGVFVGMLAAALTEVVNVIPIMAKRLKMQVHLVYLIMAMTLGKVAGSLFQWIFFDL